MVLPTLAAVITGRVSDFDHLIGVYTLLCVDQIGEGENAVLAAGYGLKDLVVLLQGKPEALRLFSVQELSALQRDLGGDLGIDHGDLHGAAALVQCNTFGQRIGFCRAVLHNGQHDFFCQFVISCGSDGLLQYILTGQQIGDPQLSVAVTSYVLTK